MIRFKNKKQKMSLKRTSMDRLKPANAPKKKTTNVAMKHGPFEDVFPIERGDIPLLCKFARGYHVSIMLYHADLTYLC